MKTFKNVLVTALILSFTLCLGCAKKESAAPAPTAVPATESPATAEAPAEATAAPTTAEATAADTAEATDADTAAGTTKSAATVTVFCRLEDGTPVPGVTVDFCTGTQCNMMLSDETGHIYFYGLPNKEYEVTPVRAPEGFSFVTDRAAAVSGDMSRVEFFLKKNN